MTRIAAVLLLLVAGTYPVHAASTCHVPGFKLIPGVAMPGAMYVTSGKSCSIAVANSAGGTQGYTITRHPSHGTVQVVGLSVRYTPKRGFVGKDSFSYIRRALDSRTNRPIELPANIDVTVMTGNVH